AAHKLVLVLIRARPLLAAVGVALLSAVVASGVTLAVLRVESRTNPQSVDIRPGATISEDSAIIQAAARARPAVVSIVTQQQPALVAGSGYLVTSDGYIVTSVDVVAGSSQLTVLISGDSKLHDARLIDYDCQTAVAVLKIDQVSGLPTLGFGDPAAVVAGQPLVAVAGPLRGGAVTRGVVRPEHGRHPGRRAADPAERPGDHALARRHVLRPQRPDGRPPEAAAGEPRP